MYSERMNVTYTYCCSTLYIWRCNNKVSADSAAVSALHVVYCSVYSICTNKDGGRYAEGSHSCSCMYFSLETEQINKSRGDGALWFDVWRGIREPEDCCIFCWIWYCCVVSCPVLMMIKCGLPVCCCYSCG